MSLSPQPDPRRQPDEFYLSSIKVDADLGKVRLISDSGEQMGIVWLREALDSAFEAGLDLIEVAPDADPPVCRIMDWGRYRFEQKQRERDQRRKQRVLEVKGLRMRPTTDDHDFGVVRRKAEQFLRQGHKVRVEVRFRGREITHRDLGEGILSKLVEALSEVCELESSAALEGRRMFIIIAPQPQIVGTSMSAEDERLAATETLHDEELAEELAEEAPVEVGESPAAAAADDEGEDEPDEPDEAD